MIISLNQCLSRSFWLIGDFKGNFDHFGYFRGIFLVISKISSVLVLIYLFFYDYYNNFGGFKSISVIWRFWEGGGGVIQPYQRFKDYFNHFVDLVRFWSF